MNFPLMFAFALIGCAAAQLDSATQGPNPQDIATPEPEYIDIDEPPPAAAAPAPAAIQSRSSFASAPIQSHSSFASAPIQSRSSFASAPLQIRSSFAPAPRPIQRPIAAVSSFARAPSQAYLAPQRSFGGGGAQLPGHVFNPQSGYQYRRPVYVRRAYRRRY